MTATAARPSTSTPGLTPTSTTPMTPASTDPQVVDLLHRCRTGLQVAGNATTAAERFAAAHLAALRAAAAVLAARPLPSRRTRLRSVWDIVPLVAPDLSEWCQFFAGTARRRAAAERGSVQLTGREADDLIQQVVLFLGEVTTRLGLPPETGPAPLLRPMTG